MWVLESRDQGWTQVLGPIMRCYLSNIHLAPLSPGLDTHLLLGEVPHRTILSLPHFFSLSYFIFPKGPYLQYTCLFYTSPI